MSSGKQIGTGSEGGAGGKGESRPQQDRRAAGNEFARSTEDSSRILEERARRLAQQPAAADQGMSKPVVEFALADERYALDAPYVREVSAVDGLTPLPGTPAFVLGVVNLRGEIVSVLDIRSFFGLPQTGYTEQHKIVFVRDELMIFGILVDAIIGARALALAEIQPPLPTLTGIEARYLKGITKDRIIVLDAERLLADPAIVVGEQHTGGPKRGPA